MLKAIGTSSGNPFPSRFQSCGLTLSFGAIDDTHHFAGLKRVLHSNRPDIVGVSQYHALVARAGHSKLSTLCVVSVPENNIYHLTDGPRFIGRTIHIVHWDGACKGSGSELVLPYIVTVNEKSVSSAVKEGLHGLCLLSVSCHNLDLDVQGVRRGGRGDHIGVGCTSLEIISSVRFIELSSTEYTSRILKQLLVDSGGVRFTRCEAQNPPPPHLSSSPDSPQAPDPELEFVPQ
jgi:hypothetical protein